MLEAVASTRVRCLLADPTRCRSAATPVGHRTASELLLFAHGCLIRRIGMATPVALVREWLVNALRGH